jgi:hypothetical protein
MGRTDVLELGQPDTARDSDARYINENFSIPIVTLAE